MYDSNTQWFSQALLTYKDKIYATDGFLRVSLSTNSSEELNYFNPPVINISITNNYQKSINLNIQNAKDLIKAFKLILPQLNGKELSIQRKYQKDTVLHFTFKLDTNDQRIVIIEIRNNESDFTKIVVPLEGVFESFASCIREYTETYMNICTQLLIQSIQSKNTQIIQQLPNLIKGISSQIISSDSRGSIESQDSRAREPVTPEIVTETETIMNDFESFLGSDMNNIEIPEIEKVEKETSKAVKIDSLFVEKYLKNNLTTLETSMVNNFMTPAPFIMFLEELKSTILPHIKDENFRFLPGISDDDLKSFTYISKCMCAVNYSNHINAGVPIPATVSVSKYNPPNYTKTNLDLAYDLLLFNIYIRTVRRRMENVTSDVMRSKALFYMQLRCFTDPLIFSFIEKINPDTLPSIILNRYDYYDSLGVFNDYKNSLDEMKCPEIRKADILSAVTELVEKVIGHSYNINEVHDNMFENKMVRIEAKNNYNLEQIVNEVIPLEIAEKLGKDLKNPKVIEDIRVNHEISDEILAIFTNEKKKVKKQKESSQKINNLVRIISSQFKDEIPEKYREDFINYLSEFDDKKFDLNDTEFPIDEFGDNVIKALYLWDPENDPAISKNYKSFFVKIENELMERDLILSKIKIKEEKPSISESIDDWDFITE
jgi:hypothetical protein